MPETIEERKLATVLFADFVGSTEFASEQDPERARLPGSRLLDHARAALGSGRAG